MGILRVIVLLFASLVVAGCAKEVPIAKVMEAGRALQTKGENVGAAIQFKNVLQREPNNVEAHFRLGAVFSETGDLLDAEKSLRRAMELGRPASEILPLLVRVLIEAENFKEALVVIGSDPKLDRATVLKLGVLRGQAHLGLGELVEAKTQFKVIQDTFPSAARTGLARAAAAEGDMAGAHKLLDEVTKADPLHANAWIAKGDLLRMDGKIEDAAAAYRRANEIEPRNTTAMLNSAILLLNDGKLAEARKEIAAAQKLSPSSPLFNFASALLAFREKRYDAARDHLQAVFRSAPRNMAAILLAGSVNFASGQLEQAQDAFVMYLNRFPGHVHARKMLAATLLRKFQAPVAVSVVQPLLGEGIKDAEFLAVSAQAYQQVGQAAKAEELLERAVSLDPKNHDIRTDLGLARLAGGDPDKAIAALEESIRLNPANARAYHHLVMTLLARKQPEKAIAAAEALRKHLPDSAESHFLSGVAYVGINDRVRARASLERALKLRPAFFPAAATLADVDRAEGRKDAVRGRFESVLKHDPRSLDAMLALAELHAAEGRMDDAVAVARQAAGDHPASLQANLVLARLQFQAGKFEDALAAARKAREANPRDARGLDLLAQIQLASDDKPGAILSLTTLVNMVPKNVAVRLRLASAQQAAGEYRNAVSTARQALAIDPGSIETKSLLGDLLLAMKRHGEGLDLARQVQAAHPDSPVGFVIEGEAWFSQGDPAKALTAFRKADAIKSSGRLRVRMHQANSMLLKAEAPADALLEWIAKHPADLETRFYTADALTRLKRLQEAVGIYQALLEKAPKDHRVLNNLAYALLQMGDRRAIDVAQEAFQLKPTDATVADTLGWALVSSGKLYEGLQILLKAVQLDGDHPEARFHLAKALEQAGDKARARAELKTLLSSGKRFPQLEEAKALAARL